MGCTYDITKQKWNTLFLNVSGWLYAEVEPQTVVWNVSDFLDIPKTDYPPTTATNWCLLTCVSSCIFTNTEFLVPTGFNVDITKTLYCMTSCYSFSEAAAAGGEAGGGSSSAGGADGTADIQKQIDNLNSSLARQIAAFRNSLDKTVFWYLDIIDRDLLNLGIVIASYALWIAQLVEHEGETMIALTIKGIGAVIEALVEVWKAITTGLHAGYATLMGSLGVITITGSTIAHAVTDAIDAAAASWGEFTEGVSGLGSSIESGGDIFGSWADILFDIKRIIFAVTALGAQIYQHVIILILTFERILEAIENTLEAIEWLKDEVASKISSLQEQLTLKNARDVLVDIIKGDEVGEILDDLRPEIQVENQGRIKTIMLDI